MLDSPSHSQFPGGFARTGSGSAPAHFQETLSRTHSPGFFGRTGSGAGSLGSSAPFHGSLSRTHNPHSADSPVSPSTFQGTPLTRTESGLRAGSGARAASGAAGSRRTGSSERNLEKLGRRGSHEFKSILAKNLQTMHHLLASPHSDSEEALHGLLNIHNNDEFLAKALPLLEGNIRKGGVRTQAGKVSRSGGRHLTVVSVYLSPAHDWLCWVPSNSLTNAITYLFRGEHRLEIAHIVRVCAGQNTTNFTRRKSRIKDKQVQSEVNRSLSAVTHDRSLDLVMKDPWLRDLWVRTLTLLCAKKNDETMEGNSFHRYLRMQWNRADEDRWSREHASAPVGRVGIVGKERRRRGGRWRRYEFACCRVIIGICLLVTGQIRYHFLRCELY